MQQKDLPISIFQMKIHISLLKVQSNFFLSNIYQSLIYSNRASTKFLKNKKVMYFAGASYLTKVTDYSLKSTPLLLLFNTAVS